MRQKNAELLNKIYRSSKTSMDAIACVMPKISSGDMGRTLWEQRDKYFKIASEASEELKSLDRLPEEQGFLEKMDFSITFRMEAFANPSSNHLAEVLINGAVSGINEIMGELHSFEGFNSGCVNLAQILIETEEETIENLQKFL